MNNIIRSTALAVAILGSLASPVQAQARDHRYGVVVDVDVVTNGGYRWDAVCRPLQSNRYDDRYGNQDDRYNDRYDDRYGNQDERYDQNGYYDQNGRYHDNRNDHDNNVGATVAGAVVGGLLGNQVGDGDGRKAATIAGAVIGGAIANKAARNNDDNRYDNNRYSYNDNQRHYDDGLYDRYQLSEMRRYDQFYSPSYDADETGRSYRLGRNVCWDQRVPVGRTIGYNVTFNVDGRLQAQRLSRAPRIGETIRVESYRRY